MLSAVSQQVQSIQLGLKAAIANLSTEIDLVGRHLKINLDTGIFISMFYIICIRKLKLKLLISNESWICWSIQLARQFEKAFSKRSYDQA